MVTLESESKTRRSDSKVWFAPTTSGFVVVPSRYWVTLEQIEMLLIKAEGRRHQDPHIIIKSRCVIKEFHNGYRGVGIWSHQ